MVPQLLALVLLAVPGHADFQKGGQTVELFSGTAYSNTSLDLHSVHGGQSRLTNAGYALALRYTYYVQSDWIFGLGAELADAEFSGRSENALVPVGASRSDARTTTFLAIVKVPYPHGTFRPYLLGGLGAHRTALLLDATPSTPWADTGTRETRHLYDSAATHIAAAFGVGLDWFPIEQLFMGLEARWVRLGSATYEVTPAGHAIGLRDVNGGFDVFNVWFKVGLKFGKILLSDRGGPAQVTRRLPRDRDADQPADGVRYAGRP